MAPRAPTQEGRNAAFRRSMQNTSHIYGVFDRIDEQNELFRCLCASARTNSPESAWRAKFGGSPRLLVDIGALKFLTGSVCVKSQAVDMEKRGFNAIWETLPQPGFKRGIGRGSQKCSKHVHLVGALHGGKLTGYSPPVPDEDASHPEAALTPPPFYGLNQFSGMSSLFDVKSGKLVCIPEGESVAWPEGIRT